MPEDADSNDLAELRALAGRLEVEPVTWDTPPADLWERIAGEAGVPTATTAGPVQQQSDRPPAAVVDLAHRRSTRRLGWVLGAAAAAAVVVGAFVATASDDAPTVVASTDLELLGATGSGRAELVDDDGTLRLRVDASDLDAGDGFLEVWVIDAEVRQLVSLGPLRPDGIYDLPPGLDPEVFPIVDVSVEPLDGDPTHSGDSVLRGQLEF